MTEDGDQVPCRFCGVMTPVQRGTEIWQPGPWYINCSTCGWVNVSRQFRRRRRGDRQ